MSLTGNRDADIEILLQRADSELPAVCSVNKYVNSICQTDAFWYRRLINRITKIKEHNFSKRKDIKNIPITGERIREMREFFGLKSLKALNDFLNKLPKNSIYMEYHGFKNNDIRISELYKFDEKTLPKYINLDELRYEMRRQTCITKYRFDEDLNVFAPSFQFSIKPNPVQIRHSVYNIYKSLEII